MDLIHNKLLQVKGFIFDVDGVMTDGSVIGTEDGFFLRSFNIKDGYAIQHAAKTGYPIAIISGGYSIGIVKRFENLGVQDIYIGQKHKEAAYNEFLNKHGLVDEDILYMGDDMPDYQLMKKVGFAACPQDAAIDIQQICTYISPKNGGHGCVRDILEKTLKLQDKWWSEHTHIW
ncbi:MAG: HAD hydrolase family protein [Bacteroidia bacterium]|nr:HAD hydrolase family protein [Bacteroidia bacterium]